MSEEKTVEHTCRHCGETFTGYEDAHDCDELPPAAGGCPLCGQEYRNGYVQHLRECPYQDE